MEEYIVCVDENDNEVCTMEKMSVHIKGILHRALSIFIFNSNGELLLQQRYKGKYHSPGLWTNTCCTHPHSNESVIVAGKRRLEEEMGFCCELKEIFSFIYKIKFDNNLTEYEYDHVLIGKYDGKMSINPLEVEDIKWISIDKIKEDIKRNPSYYTYWFKYIIENHIDDIENNIF